MKQSGAGKLCFCFNRQWRKPLKWARVTYNLTHVTFRLGPDLNEQRREIDSETNEVASKNIPNLKNTQRFRSVENYLKEISELKGNKVT